MTEKLGWYEVRAGQTENELLFCLFSRKWREDLEKGRADLYYADVELIYKKDDDGEWFVATMSVTNPTIEEFNELATAVMDAFKKLDPSSVKGMVTLLDEIVEEGLPDLD